MSWFATKGTGMKRRRERKPRVPRNKPALTIADLIGPHVRPKKESMTARVSFNFPPGLTETQKLDEILRVLSRSGWNTFMDAAEAEFLGVLRKNGKGVASDAANILLASPVWGPAIKQHAQKTGTESWKRSVFGPVINTLSRRKRIERTGITSRGRSHDGMTSEWRLTTTERSKENEMAAKKKTTDKTKTAEDPRKWHKKVMSLMIEQVGEGKALDGLTFSEARTKMGLSQGDEGFADVAVAMTDLRNENFFAHKFIHEALKEDFFEGDPTDIPNIQKRENEAKIRQLVFFLHPAAMALGDDLMAMVEKGEFPEDFTYESASTTVTRDDINGWFDSLGEVIDLYVTDDDMKGTSAKMIAALMPAKSE